MVESIHAVIQEGSAADQERSVVGSIMGRNRVGPWHPLGPKVLFAATTAEERNELTPLQSITSSARASKVAGTSRPTWLHLA
jgi:hypothetical protein